MIKTLLVTDIVNSTALTEQLGDDRMSKIWVEHDRVTRDLIQKYNGQEADRTDGFLMLFDSPNDACLCALKLHKAFEAISEKESIDFKSRIGIHIGEVILIETTDEHKAHGAKPLEVEGVAKPAAARVMSIARGGQTLYSHEAASELTDTEIKTTSHGHWRMKGVAEPMELFEAGDQTTQFQPPEDGEKVYRVNLVDDVWVPVRDTPHNLTAERDQFIGRASDLNELSERIQHGSTKLLTLLGPGGTGKTRLSKRFGRMWLGDYPGGVWFCDLAESKTLEGITAAIASAIDIQLTKGDPVAQLGNAILGRGQCLVILDNFEQIVSHASATLGKWLERAPEAKFLVTSRILLELPGEKTMVLQPLPTEQDAMLLFEARAKDRKSSFEITNENHSDVRSVVETLDGMPLAIELAAARIAVLQPRQIKERLKERFKVLRGSKDVSQRQQTLRAAIDWSWDLLEEWEKSALAQCSVFQGGFTLEAAEEIVDLSSFPDAPFTMDVIQDLVNKSLIRSDVQRYDVNEPWYGMYISIHEYCAEKLANDEAFAGSGLDGSDACRLRHMAYYSAFGTPEAINQLYIHGGIIARKKATGEIDNLWIAFSHAMHLRDQESAAQLLKVIWEVIRRIGPREAILNGANRMLDLKGIQPNHQLEVFNILLDLGVMNIDQSLVKEASEKGLELSKALEDKATEATLLTRMCQFTLYSGKYEQGIEYGERALSLARKTGNRLVEEGSMYTMASAYPWLGKFDKGEKLLKQVLEMVRESGNLELEAAILDRLGSLLRSKIGAESALDYHQQGLSKAREIGNHYYESIIINNIGQCYSNLGEFEKAVDYTDQCLQRARENGDRLMEGVALINLCQVYTDSELYDQALAYGLEGLNVFKEINSVELISRAYMVLGVTHKAAGNMEEAMHYYQELLETSTEFGMTGFKGTATYGLACVHSINQNHEKAMELFTLAESILDDDQSKGWIGQNKHEFYIDKTEAALRAGDSALASQLFKQAEKVINGLVVKPKHKVTLRFEKLREQMKEL